MQVHGTGSPRTPAVFPQAGELKRKTLDQSVEVKEENPTVTKIQKVFRDQKAHVSTSMLLEPFLEVVTHDNDEAVQNLKKTVNTWTLSEESLSSLSKLLHKSRNVRNEELEEFFLETMKKFLEECFKGYIASCPQSNEYAEYLIKYGRYLTHLDITLTDALSAIVVPLFFGKLKSLEVTAPKGLKWQAMLAGLPDLTTLELAYTPKEIDLSLFESAPNLRKLLIKKNTDIPLYGFNNPEKMTALKKLIFLSDEEEESEEQKEMITADFAQSLARLPSLQFLDLSYSDINCKHLETILSSKTLRKVEVNECNFYFKAARGCKKVEIKPVDFAGLQRKFPRVEIVTDFSIEPFDDVDFAGIITVSDEEEELLSLDYEKAKTLFSACNEELRAIMDRGYEGGSYEDYNRYVDVVPYSYNSLTSKLGFYLNASPFVGIDKKMYYAGQAPIPEAMGDFYSAIVQFDVGVIVAATPCVEGEKVKCDNYWPDVEKSRIFINQLGEVITVVGLSEERLSNGGFKRKFSIKKGDKESIVTQIHLTEWKDNTGLPSHEMYDLIQFLDRENEKDKPVFIHCSAGVGRTGLTLLCLAIEHAIKENLAQTKDQLGHLHPKRLKLDIYKALKGLRMQRPGMVQMEQQLMSAVDYFNYRIQMLHAGNG